MSSDNTKALETIEPHEHLLSLYCDSKGFDFSVHCLYCGYSTKLIKRGENPMILCMSEQWCVMGQLEGMCNQK